MSDHVDEVDLLKWPDPLGPEWTVSSIESDRGTEYSIQERGEARGTVLVQWVKDTPIRDTYPVSGHDRLLEPSRDCGPASVQLVSESVMDADPRCRRLVIATDEGDLEAIDRAERAGYRYVVDVDLPQRALTLMAAEPGWVLEESRNINDVPLESGASD